ncbi:phage protein [Oceanobacillus picturae]|uniref:Phage protein n=1 Tax=Oceanobacillus picturae TaxID=171693 RepID=A0A0U9H5Y5_9BACI|nr:hypothetical protein [Oceanobacillus picturae]GAQ18050.1 phage protein [Oceanobacillus picturae]
MSQTEYNKKWQSKNKERAKYLSNRSRARSFIKNQATLEDIEEIKALVVEREAKLKEETHD